jgi:hypothetical protein
MEDDKSSIENISDKEILEFLWKALNKANSKGVFTIDEAFSIKLLYDKLKISINNND